MRVRPSHFPSRRSARLAGFSLARLRPHLFDRARLSSTRQAVVLGRASQAFGYKGRLDACQYSRTRTGIRSDCAGLAVTDDLLSRPNLKRGGVLLPPCGGLLVLMGPWLTPPLVGIKGFFYKCKRNIKRYFVRFTMSSWWELLVGK